MNSLSQIERTQHRDQFLDEVVAGLRSSPKRLPCKLFYDARGSELFDEICELDEYYLTRSELAIMEQYASDMGAQIGEGVRLVEYGSGSSMKTRLLLEHLPSPVAYIPVDISRDYLLDVSRELQDDFPAIEVLPVVADFTQPFSIPDPVKKPTHTAVYFPGSTNRKLRTACGSVAAARHRIVVWQGWRSVDRDRSREGQGRFGVGI